MLPQIRRAFDVVMVIILSVLIPPNVRLCKQEVFPPLSRQEYEKRRHHSSAPLVLGVGSFGDVQTSQVVHSTNTTVSFPPEEGITSVREASPSSLATRRWDRKRHERGNAVHHPLVVQLVLDNSALQLMTSNP